MSATDWMLQAGSECTWMVLDVHICPGQVLCWESQGGS